MSAEVAAFLQEHERAMLDDLHDFVSRETPSSEPEMLQNFAAFLADYSVSRIGAKGEILMREANAHFRLTGGEDGRRPVLLLGHFDTVWDSGTLERMPFRVEDGRAYGPGAFDMKAGLVQGFWALRAVAEIRGQLPSFVFLCTSDEEIGSPTARPLIEEEARNAAAVLVLEPSLNGALKTARKGVARFKLDVTGRAAHAGLDPENGVSAVEELCRLVLQIYDAADPSRGTTINVGVIGGGTRYNVVAGGASAEVDARVASTSEAERVTALLSSLKTRNSGARLRVTGGLVWPPMEKTGKTEVLLRHARRIGTELGIEFEDVLAGGASDGNFCAAVGAAVLDGLGPVGAGAHAEDEHVEIKSIPVRAALLAGLLDEFDTAVAPELEQLFGPHAMPEFST